MNRRFHRCGTWTLVIALAGGIAFAQGDPDLRRGFPVQTYETGGSYQAGHGIHVLVGDVDGSKRMQIFASGLARGPLYAWGPDGSPTPGWPTGGFDGAVYPALGVLSREMPGMQVFSVSYARENALVARDGAGRTMAGWPRDAANFGSSPAALADVDGDGVDEIFVGEEDWGVHAYYADGKRLPGWPVYDYRFGAQQRFTPAIADIDGDGKPEIAFESNWTTSGQYLFAYHADGSAVAGFPVRLPSALFAQYAVIGDVDGDGELEIVVAAKMEISGRTGVLEVSPSGKLKRSWVAGEFTSYGPGIALADLDGDRTPEIVVQSDETLFVWNGCGEPLLGWPRHFPSQRHWDSAPVVGDVDGDGLPDIVVAWPEEVDAFNRCGAALEGFPKGIPMGIPAVPAIADLDGNGHNEVILMGEPWDGTAHLYDRVWVLDTSWAHPDAKYGPIEWGQFQGGPRHQGVYVSPCAR